MTAAEVVGPRTAGAVAALSGFLALEGGADGACRLAALRDSQPTGGRCPQPTTVPTQAWDKGRAEAPAYGTSALLLLLFLRQHDGQRQEPKSLKFSSNISGGRGCWGALQEWGMSLNSHGFSASTPGAYVGREQDSGLRVGAAGCPSLLPARLCCPAAPAVSREAPSGVDLCFTESAVASGIPFMSKPCPPGEGPCLDCRLPFWQILAICIVSLGHFPVTV